MPQTSFPKAKTPEELEAEAAAGGEPSQGLGSLKEQDEKKLILTRDNVRDNPGLLTLGTPPPPGSTPQMPPPADPAFNPLADVPLNPPEPYQGPVPNVPGGGGGGSGLAVEQQRQVTSGVQVSPELIKTEQQTFDDRVKAERAKAKVESDYAQFSANVVQKYTDDQLKEAEAVKEREIKRKADIEDRIKGYDAAVDEMLKTKINPNQFYENKGTGGKIMAALAIGLGAYGAAQTGGPNMAAKIISDAIDRDIDAQKSNLQNLQQGVVAKKTAYSMVLEKVGDARAAEAVTRDMMLRDAMNQVQLTAAKSKQPAVLAQADALIAGLKEGKVQNDIKRFESAQDKVVNTTVMRQKDPSAGMQKPSEITEAQSKTWDLLHKKEGSFAQWKEATNTLERFKEMKASGADSAALLDLIAVGMKQGSISEKFKEILKKRGIVDKTGNVVREFVLGGEDPVLMKELETGLTNTQQRLQKDAKSFIEMAMIAGRDMGQPNFYIGDIAGNALRRAPSDARNRK